MMMRSAKFTESAICEPPKPRFTTGRAGKSAARLVQRLMLELPTKRMQPLGGGLVLSLASNAAISFSHCAELCEAREFGGAVWQPAHKSASMPIHHNVCRTAGSKGFIAKSLSGNACF